MEEQKQMKQKLASGGKPPQEKLKVMLLVTICNVSLYGLVVNACKYSRIFPCYTKAQYERKDPELQDTTQCLKQCTIYKISKK